MTWLIYIQVITRSKASGAALDYVDACSMLKRLELEGKVHLTFYVIK